MTDPPPPTPAPVRAIPVARHTTAGPGPADPAALTALLAEYNSLRTESLQAISNRIQIMNFAFTSLAVVTAAMITSDLPRGVLIPACLLFVPGAAKASLLIWLGEYHRSQRAGQGVAAVERRINSLLGTGDVLSWESRLVSAGTHMGYPYIATAVFILSTGVLAQSLGGYFLVGRLAPSPTLRDDLAVVGGVLLYAVLCETLFLRFFIRRWRAIRSATHSG
ncbi:hypothetical protein ACIOKD_13745 [Streptomyces sp. NPDC087844]|uniref:hypothetical protein n=1 Tax=Streptomyces sp. NPDC087844 TaxID=3365805 RepID=UPI0038246DD0